MYTASCKLLAMPRLYAATSTSTLTTAGHARHFPLDHSSFDVVRSSWTTTLPARTSPPSAPFVAFTVASTISAFERQHR
ncbi:hypothetical protein OH76DRAFT_585538 [Lentinus brumalis]|uniref:Uncharacterized protein n=1 Tax=Lentinus brumalis TaxID=2498619 RepID=A0A371DTV2_9APHY|nr:hypothetical protein OH76DRAFT_585538 [Polyporus brumalis]